jgi:hypothetical protein
MDAKKGQWVQIYQVVLKAGERSPNLPEDTKKVDLEMRLKGFLEEDANIGDEVKIKTVIGRTVTGRLESVNPRYDHDFGNPIPELLTVGMEAREILRGDSK